MPTYNHEEYIAEAIESVLAQEVDFRYELLIGEDDSSDDKRDIVRQYAEQTLQLSDRSITTGKTSSI